MGYSYREGCVKRKTARRAKDAIQPKPRVGNAKNTKKWCKGVVGRSHSCTCVSWREYKRVDYAPVSWKLFVCTECGRELDYWMPVSHRDCGEQPAWVR